MYSRTPYTSLQGLGVLSDPEWMLKTRMTERQEQEEGEEEEQEEEGEEQEEKEEEQKQNNNNFIHDLSRAFFFGKKKKWPMGFYDLLIPKGVTYVENLSIKFKNKSLNHMRIELENILVNIDSSLYITFKIWKCACPGRHAIHYFPERVCISCGVGIKMYDNNFGIVTLIE